MTKECKLNTCTLIFNYGQVHRINIYTMMKSYIGLTNLSIYAKLVVHSRFSIFLFRLTSNRLIWNL